MCPRRTLNGPRAEKKVGRGFMISLFRKKIYRRDDLDSIPLEQIRRIRSLLRKKQNLSQNVERLCRICSTIYLQILQKTSWLNSIMEIEGYYPEKITPWDRELYSNPEANGSHMSSPEETPPDFFTPNTSQLCSKLWKRIDWKPVLFFVLSRNWFW